MIKLLLAFFVAIPSAAKIVSAIRDIIGSVAKSYKNYQRNRREKRVKKSDVKIKKEVVALENAKTDEERAKILENMHSDPK